MQRCGAEGAAIYPTRLRADGAWWRDGARRRGSRRARRLRSPLAQELGRKLLLHIGHRPEEGPVEERDADPRADADIIVGAKRGVDVLGNDHRTRVEIVDSVVVPERSASIAPTSVRRYTWRGVYGIGSSGRTLFIHSSSG